MGQDTYTEPLTIVEKFKKIIGLKVLVSDSTLVQKIASSGTQPLQIINGRTNKFAFNLVQGGKLIANLDEVCVEATRQILDINTQGNIIFADAQSMQEALNKQKEEETAQKNANNTKAA